MARLISELLPDVMIEAPGCVPAIALSALSSAVRDFLTRTRAWKQWVGPIELPANTGTLVIPNLLDDDTKKWQRMDTVESLRWHESGRDIPFMTHDQLQDLDPRWRERTGSEVRAWTHEIANDTTIVPPADPSSYNVLAVRLVPIPEVLVANAVDARIVITTHTYSELFNAVDTQRVYVPENLFHRYRDVWVRGALARLLRMGGRDWTDKTQAREYQQWFENDIIGATSESDAEFGQPVLTVEYGGY